MATRELPIFQQRAAALTDNQFETGWESNAASLAALTKPKEQSFVFPFKRSAYRIVVTTNQLPAPAWIEPTISAFIEIQSLPDNWDSYGAKSVNRDLIAQSFSTLQQIMEATSPTPSVVPLGDGGLQLEWHRKQQDLEVIFPANERPQFFYQNRATGAEKEGFATEVVALMQLLRKIA